MDWQNAFHEVQQGVFWYAQTFLALFPWWSGRNARYFLPLGIDCGREFIHLFEEHRDFPDLLVLQRGGKARHRREADSMLHLPKRRGLGIIFDSIFGAWRTIYHSWPVAASLWVFAVCELL